MYLSKRLINKMGSVNNKKSKGCSDIQKELKKRSIDGTLSIWQAIVRTLDNLISSRLDQLVS